MSFEALLADQPVAQSSAANPVALHPGRSPYLTLLVSNTSSHPVTMAHVRIEGSLLGLNVVDYDTAIDETLAVGENRILRFPLDLFDLEGQAHGLLRGDIGIYDADGSRLASTPVFLDGRGSVLATTSLVTLVLLAFAAVGIGWNLNRFSLGLQAATRLGRGLHLLHPGASAGLAVSSAMATLRIWPPSASTWVLLTVAGAVGGGLVGYLSPGPDLGMQFPVVDLTRQPEQPIRIPSDY